MFRRTWQHANGAVMPIAKLAVDTGYAGGLERKRWLLAHEASQEGTVQGAFALD